MCVVTKSCNWQTLIGFFSRHINFEDLFPVDTFGSVRKASREFRWAPSSPSLQSSDPRAPAHVFKRIFKRMTMVLTILDSSRRIFK